MQFRDWFFQQFPDWHQNNDVNLDNNGDGVFQRYLRGFGMELDGNVVPYITNFLDIVDVTKTEDKYLPLVATILGSPPSVGDNMAYRKLLAYIVAIYKVKGTKKAYQLLFHVMGLDVSIIETSPKKKITYDQPNITYDQDPMNVYDSFCEYCSKYQLAYISGLPVPPSVLTTLTNIICFIQPINAKFDGLIKGYKFGDELKPGISETVKKDNTLIYPQ